MPSSIRSTSSSTDRRRLSQSLNRVALLGALSGIDDARLPPFRTDSLMTVMQDELRAIYGAPSLESLTSVDAVVTQVANPNAGPDAPPLTEPETGRRSRRGSLALSDSGRSVQSTTSTASGRSRSRARNQALAQQYSTSSSSPVVGSEIKDPYLRQQLERCRAERAVDSSGSVVSRPPLSHPEILMPGHLRARSEAAIDSGSSTAWKRQSMALKGGQSRKTLAMPEPDWVKETVKGSRFARSDASAAAGIDDPFDSRQFPANSTFLGWKHTARADYAAGPDSYRSRRSSMATVTQENFLENAKVESSTPRLESGKGGNRSASLVRSEDDELHSNVHSGATPNLHLPRGFRDIVTENKDDKRIVRARGVNFEMMDAVRVRTEPAPGPRSFRPLSVAVPPSQRSTSSFSVKSVTRSPTVSVSPTESSFASSPRLSEGSTRPSTRSSTATSAPRSRSPSPARGSFNPHEKSMLARVEKFSDDFARKSYHMKQNVGLEPRDFKVISGPHPTVHISVALPTSPWAPQPHVEIAPTGPVQNVAASPTSFSQRANAAAAASRGPPLSLQIPQSTSKAPVLVPKASKRNPASFARRVASTKEPEPGPNKVIIRRRPLFPRYPLSEQPLVSSYDHHGRLRSGQNILNRVRELPAPHMSNGVLVDAPKNIFAQNVQFPWCKSPPLFATDLQRSDSLFMGGSKPSAAAQNISSLPSREEGRPAASIDACNRHDRPILADLMPKQNEPKPASGGEPIKKVDDRRRLPSQREQASSSSSSSSPSGPSLQHPAVLTVPQAGGPVVEARPNASRLRKTTPIDFSKFRAID